MQPLNTAILTISDSRTLANDTSGGLLAQRVAAAGHQLVSREITKDNRYEIRARISNWIVQPGVDVILTTGGTGLTGRDGTPEAITPLLEKEIPGFGELFRYFSIEQVGVSAIQSRCLAGVANGTLIFCLPGSTKACALGWDKILQPQLDDATKPCNFVQLLPRLQEDS